MLTAATAINTEAPGGGGAPHRQCQEGATTEIMMVLTRYAVVEHEGCGKDDRGRTTCTKSTARGFEPLRADPNGFLVHHLSHSVTLSHMQRQARLHDTTVTEMHREPNSHASADVDRQFKQQSPLQHDASVAASSAACLPHWQPSCRQRGDLSPCGQSPMDF